MVKKATIRCVKGLKGAFFMVFGLLVLSVHAQLATNDVSSVRAFFQQVGDNQLQNSDSLDNEVRKKLAFISTSDSSHLFPEFLNSYGSFKQDAGEFLLADSLFTEVFQWYRNQSDTLNMAKSCQRRAAVMTQNGQYNLAIEQSQIGLNLLETSGDTLSSAYGFMLMRIGEVYRSYGDPDKALEYFSKSLSIARKSENPNSMAGALSSMSTIMQNKGNFEQALVYLTEARTICEENNLEFGLSIILNNIGFTYKEMGKLPEAIEFYELALEQKKKVQHSTGIAYTLNELGEVYAMMGDYSKGIELSQQAYQICKEQNAVNILDNIAKTLHDAYAGTGDYENALKYYTEYVEIKDSLHTDDKMRELGQMEANFEFQKQKALAQKEYEKELALEQQKQKNRELAIVFISFVSILISLLLLIIYRRLKITRKQKVIIEEQKEEVEAQRDEIERQKARVDDQHTEITSSINYAQRIQNALLENEESWDEVGEDRFIFFKPRDVVSGDFYWAYTDERYTIWVCADCTGHGVPGAFMSLLGIGFLQQVIVEEQQFDPAAILNGLRHKIINSLKLDKLKNENAEGESTLKDGMDLALCVYDKGKNILKFAGANNPLYLMKNGTLEVLKGNKMPVGKHNERGEKPFEQVELSIEPNTWIYSFSDGFADQFGGPKGKKYGYKRFRELILELSNNPSEHQKRGLEKAFESWKQERNEPQLDDICIIGVKLYHNPKVERT